MSVSRWARSSTHSPLPQWRRWLALLGLIDEAELDVVGDEGEHLAGVLPRHRVVIAVEVDEAGLVDAQGQDQVRGGGRLWQGEEPRALLDEAVGDGAGGEARVRARVGDGLDEAAQLAVALLDGGDGPASEEAIAQVADGPLDLAFLKSTQLHVVRQVGRSPSRSPTLPSAPRPQVHAGGPAARGEKTASTSTLTRAN
jgi:hypothetical protein